MSGFGLEHTDLAENSFQTSRIFTFMALGSTPHSSQVERATDSFYLLDEHTA